jgi:hypothetical protein
VGALGRGGIAVLEERLPFLGHGGRQESEMVVNRAGEV